MFGKKKIQTTDQKKEADAVRVTVIPAVFYGGADPLIYHTDVSRKSQTTKAQNLPIKDEKKTAVVVPMSKTKVIIIVVVLSVLAVGGISFYYFWQARGDTPTPEELAVNQPEQQPVVVPEPTPTPVVVTTTPIVEPEPIIEPIITSTSTRPLTFPLVLLRDSADMDADSLTDSEEELLKTDSGVWDTDKDGYYDGQEVSNLYNPTGFAPVRLVDSGLVKEYANPTWQYRMYYPIDWEVASVDTKADHVLFSSITGDFVEVRAIPNSASESFSTWFSKNITDQKFSDITMSNNRFNVVGYKRQDSLVSYFPGDKVVYVIIYQPASDAQDIPFRHMVQMMVQSFRLSQVTTDIPEQPVLPPAPTTDVTTSTL